MSREKRKSQDDAILKVNALIQQGMQAKDACREIGVPQSTYIFACKRLGLKSTVEIRSELNERRTSEIIGVTSSLDKFRASSGNVEPISDISGEKLWEGQENRNHDRLSRMIRSIERQFDFSELDYPIMLVCFSDIHFGDLTDLRELRYVTELVADCPYAYAVDAGDVVDNFIKQKHHHVALDYETSIENQWKLFDYWCDLLGEETFLASIGGNHDLWTQVVSGIDFKKFRLKPRDIAYNPDQMRMVIAVGEQVYHIQLTHRFRVKSMYNPAHEAMQFVRFGTENPDLDAVVIGDKHEPYIARFDCNGRPMWFARPGSAKPYDPYSRSLSFNPVRFTTPTFTLFPDRHEIVGHEYFQQALIYLKGCGY